MSGHEKSVLDLFAELMELKARMERLDRKHIRTRSKANRLEKKFNQVTDKCGAAETQLCQAFPTNLIEAACQAELLATFLDSARDFDAVTKASADQTYELSLNILRGLAHMAGHEIRSGLRPVNIRQNRRKRIIQFDT